MTDTLGSYPHFRLNFEQQGKRAKDLLKAARALDQLAVLLPEREVEAMLLQAVGDAAAVEAVLQLPHAVVIEGGAIDRVGHLGPWR